MAEWDALPTDILALIANGIENFEDLCNFYAVCKSWHLVTSILGLPSRFPWVMLTDKAEINFPKYTKGMYAGKMLVEAVQKNEQIQGMQNRQFYSFSASKAYEFTLPEATRKRCLGVGYGLLVTIGYDLQINILNPFTRQQIGLPDIYTFKTQFREGELSPHRFVQMFIGKAVMSSNPYLSRNREDCIIMAIYGEYQKLAFTRLGDKVWTDIHDVRKTYEDVVYYNGKFYALNWQEIIVVSDINDVKGPKATAIACCPDDGEFKYLVESSGDLLLVIRYRKGPTYVESEDEEDEEDINQLYDYTVGFSILKLEECDGDSGDNYPYKLTQVKSLGNNALFIGNNASVSVPSSTCVKANSIYFSDNDYESYGILPNGGGYDTGIYDVESGNITLHYASKFMSFLTPPIWIIT